MMATVRYVGRHDAVTVPLPLGGEAEVARGETFNTSDEHAAGLCEQVDNWRLEVRAPADKKPAAPVSPAAPDKEEKEV